MMTSLPDCALALVDRFGGLGGLPLCRRRVCRAWRLQKWEPGFTALESYKTGQREPCEAWAWVAAASRIMRDCLHDFSARITFEGVPQWDGHPALELELGPKMRDGIEGVLYIEPHPDSGVLERVRYEDGGKICDPPPEWEEHFQSATALSIEMRSGEHMTSFRFGCTETNRWMENPCTDCSFHAEVDGATFSVRVFFPSAAFVKLACPRSFSAPAWSQATVIAEVWSDENNSVCEPHGAEYEDHTREHYISLPAPCDFLPHGPGDWVQNISDPESQGLSHFMSFDLPYQPNTDGVMRVTHLSLCILDVLGHTAFQTVLPIEEQVSDFFGPSIGGECYMPEPVLVHFRPPSLQVIFPRVSRGPLVEVKSAFDAL